MGGWLGGWLVGCLSSGFHTYSSCAFGRRHVSFRLLLCLRLCLVRSGRRWRGSSYWYSSFSSKRRDHAQQSPLLVVCQMSAFSSSDCMLDIKSTHRRIMFIFRFTSPSPTPGTTYLAPTPLARSPSFGKSNSRSQSTPQNSKGYHSTECTHQRNTQPHKRLAHICSAKANPNLAMLVVRYQLILIME